MEYEGQICRPPMERSSFMLPVAVGCSYNRCTFCTLFKHLRYRQLPIEQVEAELQRVHDAGGNPEQVFLGDGNAFCMSTDHLLRILELVHRYLPGCRMVNMDATITNISQKSDEELKQLYDQGVRRLYIGIETGLDDVLTFYQKGPQSAAGLHPDCPDAAGGTCFQRPHHDRHRRQGRGMENAEKTAEFFNRTHPERITNFSLFLHRRAPLYQDYQTGRFVPASELDNLIEDRRLIELLDVPGLVYDGFHDMLKVRVRGTLPQDKEKMLKQFDEAIEKYRNEPPVYAVLGDEHEFSSNDVSTDRIA